MKIRPVLARLAIVSVYSGGLAFVMAAATPAANVLAPSQDAFGWIGTTTDRPMIK
jgi:hypothetical protein